MTAQELKNSILQLAIQGKLVKQDPNDEPASVLLERIKEERKKLIKEKKIKKEKYSEIYKDPSDNHYYEKFEDDTVNDVTEEIPFDIPDSWRWVRHNQLFEIVGGSQPPKSEFSDIQEKNFVRLYQIRDYGDKPVPIYVDKNKVSKFSQKGDIILARYGGSLGKVFWAEDGAYNVALAKVCKKYESKNIIFDEFLFTYYSSSIYQLFVKSASRSAQAGFNKEDLNSLFFALPPYNEQKKIVEKIKYFTPYIEKYDNTYNRLEKLNNSYKEELKKSILQYAIQGKLVKQDQNDEPADVLINKILSKKRELIKSKKIKKENLSVIYKDNTDNQFYEKFDDGTIKNITDEIPFDIPDNWAWTRLNNIGTIIGGGTPKTNIKDNWENANIPWLTPADMKNIKGIYAERGQRNISEIGLKNSSAKLMPAGTILYSSRAPIGYIAIARNPVSTNQGFKSVVLVRNEINLFLYYELIQKTPEIISRASGTTFKEISGADFGKTIVTIPPMEEQERIVNKLNQVLNYIEAAE